MIGFRIATRQGIGHLMRMKWLAKSLLAEQETILFIIDKCEASVLELVNNIECNIVQIDIYNPEYTLDHDSQKTISALAQFKCTHLIIDSYWHGKSYEQSLVDTGIELTVFDDLEREHVCHRIFDQKWQGLKTASRYEKSVPDNTVRYLGPKFCILSPDYINDCINSRINKKVEKDKSTLLFSLGGGGDLILIVPIIKALLINQLYSESLIIKVIVGPQTKGAEALFDLCMSNNNFELIHQPSSLISYYLEADLFIGALGTSLYELAVTNTLALTFTIADNQSNNISNLEDFGHYFHLPSSESLQSELTVQLIITMLKNSDRIQILRDQALIKIDGSGAERIAKLLVNGTEGKNNKKKVRDDSCIDGIILAKDERAIDVEWLTTTINVRAVNDSDINHYRFSRNLPNNAERMTISENIPELIHYNWWFNNSRHSFVLSDENQAKLYIWHDLHCVKGNNYLYGGWFTTGEEVPFNIAMLALKWQLNKTKALFPEAVWLAVINKKNRFVNLLNQYMGFSEIGEYEDGYHVTRTIFPNAKKDDFNFVHLACKDIK